MEVRKSEMSLHEPERHFRGKSPNDKMQKTVIKILQMSCDHFQKSIGQKLIVP